MALPYKLSKSKIVGYLFCCAALKDFLSLSFVCTLQFWMELSCCVASNYPFQQRRVENSINFYSLLLKEDDSLRIFFLTSKCSLINVWNFLFDMNMAYNVMSSN